MKNIKDYWKNIISEDTKVLKMNKAERVIECIKKYRPEKIILFGSYVRGDSDEYSDLDFVVVKKTKKRFLERLIEVAKLIDNDLGKVDVFVYTPEEFQRMVEWENPFIQNVLREGRVVYEKK
jgi:predicted nucleotidyltransferase